MTAGKGIVLGMLALLVSFTLAAPAQAGADFNGDAMVNLDDFIIWKINFGATGITWNIGDANEDDRVDIFDFVELKRQFGSDPSAPLTTNGPATPSSDLRLFVSETGEVLLQNPSAASVSMDGYQINHPGGMLNIEGWYTFTARAMPNPNPGIPPLPGELEFSGFGSFCHDGDAVCEVTLSFEPLQIPAGRSISLGDLASDLDWRELEFLWSNAADDGVGVYEGPVVPEPATLSLLTAGLLAGLRRRR